MEKVMPGVWYSKTNVTLHRYVASFNERRYFILADSHEFASEKAADHFGKVDFQIQEL